MPIIPYLGVVFPFMGLLSFLFVDDFEGNANISAAIKSSSTVHEKSPVYRRPLYFCSQNLEQKLPLLIS